MSPPLRADKLTDGPSAAAVVDASADSRDPQWVSGVRAGDSTAFRAMFEAYYESLWTVALAYVRIPEVAEDLVQDVFAQVWMARERWVVRESGRRYLWGAVRNRALKHVRHEHVVSRWEAAAAHDLGIAGVAHGPPRTDASVLTHELAAALDRAVAGLPRRQRDAYRLRQFGLSNAEIAAIMGISEKGVAQSRMRALKALREALRHMR